MILLELLQIWIQIRRTRCRTVLFDERNHHTFWVLLSLPGVQVWNADFRQQMVHRSSLCCKDFVVLSTSVRRARVINERWERLGIPVDGYHVSWTTGEWRKARTHVTFCSLGTEGSRFCIVQLRRMKSGFILSILAQKSRVDPGTPSTSTARPNRSAQRRSSVQSVPNLTCFLKKECHFTLVHLVNQHKSKNSNTVSL